MTDDIWRLAAQAQERAEALEQERKGRTAAYEALPWYGRALANVVLLTSEAGAALRKLLPWFIAGLLLALIAKGLLL